MTQMETFSTTGVLVVASVVFVSTLLWKMGKMLERRGGLSLLSRRFQSIAILAPFSLVIGGLAGAFAGNLLSQPIETPCGRTIFAIGAVIGWGWGAVLGWQKPNSDI